MWIKIGPALLECAEDLLDEAPTLGGLNQLCMMPLFTKQELTLIFSSLKKSSFLKSMLLLNFWIQSSSN